MILNKGAMFYFPLLTVIIHCSPHNIVIQDFMQVAWGGYWKNN